MTVPTDIELMALAARVADRLMALNRHLVTAESCTGGWIAKVCTDLPGSSRWFNGGVIAYANEFKTGSLGVRPALIATEGAVSQAAVREMATGALGRLGGDIAVAVSGIAGPDGGAPGKPVGSVWFAWAVKSDDRAEVRTQLEVLAGDREAVRRGAVACALRGVLEV
jgi:nicotinamide-nucleotide amidase